MKCLLTVRIFYTDILQDLLQNLQSDEINEKISGARDQAGNDMVKYMQLVFPLVAQVQAEVIEKHGFYGERGGRASLRFYCTTVGVY